MRPRLQVWIDFASTYSYPAVMRLPPLARSAGVDLDWRPFLLGPIFKSLGWTTSPFNLQPHKGRYMWRDLERICAALGLPFVRPDPFPQASLLAARTGLVALEEGFAEDFIMRVFAAEFAHGKDIGDAGVLNAIVTDLGYDASATLHRADTAGIKSRLRAATDEAARLEIFGAPSFITEDGELFWGNDRLEQALSWAARER